MAARGGRSGNETMTTNRESAPVAVSEELRAVVQRAVQGDRSALPALRKLL